MARAKKEAALTPEERLQAALVPDWERPYKLPENWCWTTIKNIATVVTGGTPAKNNSDYYGGEFPFFKPADLDAGRHVSEASEYLSDLGKSISRIIPAQATAVCCIGSIGKCGFLDVEGATNQQINSAIPYFNALYQYFYMNTEFFTNQLRNSASATTIAIVNKTKMESCYYPLAPLAEQQRIVDCIESLFAKLDEAKEKAQAVVDSFETRKAAILHKAFTGELTAKWRRTHGLSLDTWKEVAADSLFEYVTSGSRGWAKYYDESGAVFIRMGNLDHGTIELDFSDIQHVKLPNKAEGQRSRIRKNDILISITADVGMVGLVRNDDFEGYINQHIALARPVMSESAEFIAWYLVSDIGLKQMQEKQRGATKVGLNLNDIRALQLKIPLIEEQNEILKVIKMWIGKEQQSQEAAEAVLDQIDLMKKSILARAFRGELGTNDPSEESAVELLKQVIEQEDGDVIRPKAKAKRIAIPAEIKPLLSGANEEAIVKLLLKAAPQSVSTQTVMSISKKKFELMDALRNLEKKQIVSKSDSGEYSLVR